MNRNKTAGSDHRHAIDDGSAGSAGTALATAPEQAPRCVAVLVVEDHPEIRDAVVSLLKEEGYEAYAAEDGRHALDLLPQVPHPVLVLADLVMPVMNGWELLRALEQDDRFALLPVVIVSAEENVPSGYRRIKKPVRVEELLGIVGLYCRRQDESDA